MSFFCFFYRYNPFAPRIISDGGGRFAEVSVDENTTSVTDVETWDFFSTEENGRLTYSIVGGSDAGFFSIDEKTGALFFQESPDYENPLDEDGNNIYTVTIQVKDGAGFTDRQTIQVKVLDVDEIPPNEAPVIISDGGGDTATLQVTETRPL